MDKWLRAALDYIPRWLELQTRASERPGCAIAIQHGPRTVLDLAFGQASLATGEALTTRHLFRIASHSKSFTATGILRLREQGRLQLDDPVGHHVAGLHPSVAKARIAQVLSHSAGIVRDGPDSGQFIDRRPFLDRAELMAQLAEPGALPAGERFKYSNHGYALLGQLIEAVTGEAYADWMQREIIDAAGLKHTVPDALPGHRLKLADGHSGKALLGRRVVIPGGQSARAIAPAGGFVGTAADLARFYAQLMPEARRSVLSAESRREMVRRHWQVLPPTPPAWYGLGVAQGSFQGWDWFGHGGALQGYISRSVALPRQQLAISVLTNSIDGLAAAWVDGMMQILQTFATHGAPSARTRAWSGRWWNLWGAVDLVPVQDKVLAVSPLMFQPFTDATELTVQGKDRAVMTQAGGYASPGEPARLVRDAGGAIKEVWLGGSCLKPEAATAREVRRRYEA
jgi:CubicO group peptidase (beta-lactamase class C family)